MRIEDWDDAYSNRDHIADADGFIARWPVAAEAFRQDRAGASEIDLAYGDGPRNRFDLFHPDGRARGLVVWVHGGYWRAFDKSYWSHFAAGPLARGWAVAMPSYTLAPDAGIADITREIGQAVTAAADRMDGPIRLAGHSAGGHLVTRMVCEDTPLAAGVQARIVHTLSVSGVHDLRPLLRTEMNADLRLTPGTAAAESPALLAPSEGARVTVWVGGAERPEFVRQSTLLANIWTGLGADMAQVKEPAKHHFDVIDGFCDANAQITGCLLGDG